MGRPALTGGTDAAVVRQQGSKRPGRGAGLEPCFDPRRSRSAPIASRPGRGCDPACGHDRSTVLGGPCALRGRRSGEREKGEGRFATRLAARVGGRRSPSLERVRCGAVPAGSGRGTSSRAVDTGVRLRRPQWTTLDGGRAQGILRRALWICRAVTIYAACKRGRRLRAP